MSAAFAVPAAVRPPRSVVARRVLLTLLFLGAFFALAVVLGGSAQAASGTEDQGRKSAGPTAELLTSGKDAGSGAGAATGANSGKDTAGGPKPGGSGDDDTGQQQRDDVQQSSGSADSGLVGPLAEAVDRTGAVTRPAGKAVEDVVGSAGLRELPGRLGLGELGGAPGERAVPGGGHAAGMGTDCPSRATAGAPEGRVNEPYPSGDRDLAPAVPAPAAAHQTTADDGVPSGDGSPADRLPGHHTPVMPASGASSHAGEGQSQRGGPHDLAAVLPADEHFGTLRPGAALAADGTPTRERSGDILEFPG